MILRPMRWAIAAVVCVVLAPCVASADPDALWKIVHDRCVPGLAAGDPAPCVQVEPAEAYAVLKDLHGKLQFLVIPTDRVTGIESPLLLASNAHNYWADAWQARQFVEARAGRPIPREDLGLAVNSAYGRSQNQLHIHIDCISATVRQVLQANQARIGSAWSDLADALAGHHYRAMRLDGEDLGTRNPFKLLAEHDPAARADMGRYTLALIGAQLPGGPGFYLLDARADNAGTASSEELLDHDCAVLGQAAP